MKDNEPTTVEDMMSKQNTDIAKWITYIIGAVVYVSAVLYAESYGFAMLNSMTSDEYRMWSTVGMLAAGITALTLPVMLIIVIKDTLQWVISFMFYMVDLAIMGANAVVGAATNSGAAMTEWEMMYKLWLLPMIPVVVGIGWVTDFLLDPDIRRRIKLAKMSSAIEAARMNMAVKHASTKVQTDRISQQAEIDADNFVGAALGSPVFSLPRSAVRDAPYEADTVLHTPPPLDPTVARRTSARSSRPSRSNRPEQP